MKKYLAVLLTLLLLTGCHRENIPETDTASETEAIPETDAETIPETVPETELPETDSELPPADPIPEPEKPEPFARLVSGEENFAFSTLTIPGDFRMCWEYD